MASSHRKTLFAAAIGALALVTACLAWLYSKDIDVVALARTVLPAGAKAERFESWRATPLLTRLQIALRYETAGEDEPFHAESLATLSPAAMLDFLEIRHPFCHGAAHDLGAAILARSQDVVKALDTCSTRCSNGCMHGVLGEAFAQHPAADVTAKDAAPTPASDSLCTRKAVISRYKPGNCAHAVGHALMKLSAAKPDRALSQCAGFSDKSMEYYCATGVFMSYEEQRDGQDAPIAAGSGPPPDFPCTAGTKFPAACYRYFLSHLSSEESPSSDQLRGQCLALPERQRMGCFHGLGAYVIDDVGGSPALLAKVCGQGNEADRALCIEGAIEKLSDHDPAAAERACVALSGEDQQVCLAAAHDGMYRLDKPTMKYYLP